MAHEVPGPQPQGPVVEPEAQAHPTTGWDRARRFVSHPATITVLLVGVAGGIVYGASKINEGRQQEGAVPPPTATATPKPSEAPGPVPTSAPRITSETAAPVCQSAKQLGPWPPETNGQFHNIEIDGTQKRAFVEAELWLPDGPAKTEFWINMSGRRVTFKNAAGTAFQWNGNCDPKVISTEIAAAKARRTSEEVNVVELSLPDFMAKFPGRVEPMPGDGTTR